MRPNRSQIIAIFAMLLIGAWFLYNFVSFNSSAPETNGNKAANVLVPSVQTRNVTAKPHAANIKLFGRTEASREVMIKAETPGPVVATPIAEGSVIQRGTVICRQDINARQANVDQAKALLKTRDLEYKAAQELVTRGFASETQALTAQAALDAAKAGVKQAEIELDNVNLRAPFSGIYDRNLAEIGDYLAPGQPCGLLIELDPLITVVDLTESQLSEIKPGQSAEISLATGEIVEGIVKFIESRANPATRTFRAEIATPNKELKLKAGVTATVKFSADPVKATLIPSQILALDDNGTVGVKYLDPDNVVRFAVTTTIDETKDGVWVSGLPSSTRIIIKGQDFVATGITAEGTDEYAQ